MALSFYRETTKSAAMKFGVGVIGATGFIGVPYREEIRDAPKDARIVALCARRRDRLDAAAREDGAQLITEDWRRVVEHAEVNLVLICTPDALHYEAAMASAAQKKHLLCEKPLGVNAREAFEIWTAYRDAGLGHYVPFWTRYVDIFRRGQEIVAEGALGEIKSLIYRWHNPRPAAMPFTWRDDAELSAAGSIADVGSHAYDTMRWILGEEARRVLVHAAVITPPKPDLGPIDLGEALEWGESHAVGESERRRGGTTFDYASIAIEFQSGVVGSLVLSHAPALRKGLAPELELHGTEASLGIDRITGAIRLARPGKDVERLETVPDAGFGNRFSKHVFPALRQRAAGRESHHPGLDDGWRAQIFTDAALRSARLGAWTELAEVEAESSGAG